MLQYKNMNNANVFDMNTEIRNLASFNLELVEKVYGDISGSSTRRSTISFSRSSLTKMPAELEELKSSPVRPKSDAKKEYEYIYNKYTAAAYNVTFARHPE